MTKKQAIIIGGAVAGTAITATVGLAIKHNIDEKRRKQEELERQRKIYELIGKLAETAVKTVPVFLKYIK